jgi:hypothetical protein
MDNTYYERKRKDRERERRRMKDKKRIDEEEEEEEAHLGLGETMLIYRPDFEKCVYRDVEKDVEKARCGAMDYHDDIMEELKHRRLLHERYKHEKYFRQNVVPLIPHFARRARRRRLAHRSTFYKLKYSLFGYDYDRA